MPPNAAKALPNISLSAPNGVGLLRGLYVPSGANDLSTKKTFSEVVNDLYDYVNPRTGKKNIEAWYAPKIPYSYGIMNYYGLPGVILEINRNTLTITAVKIELNPINKIIIKEPKKIKKLSRKEFDVLKRKSFSEFYKKN